ncbi:MAG: hypothetical protein ACYTGB_04665, partial [Planctomycetota bacterium]
QPYNLDLSTWYHIKAIYKSTRLGGQAFVVDGTQVAPAGPGRYDPMTKLVGDLDDTSTPSEIDVETTAGFPSRGAVVIDSEIFEYDGKNPTQFLRVRRARRYTQMHPHTGGAAVQIYGYSVKVSGSIPLVSGRVSGDMEANPRCRIDMPPSGTPPSGGGIDDDDTEIKVDDTDGFQPSGYIWVGRECIYYDRISATKFLDCERGVRGTTAADHADRSRISAASLRVSSLAGYPGSGYVQIDDAGNRDRVEWLHYSEKRPYKDRRYLLPAVLTDSRGRKYLESWRGRFGTGFRPHDDGAKVIPVFRLQGPQCGDRNSPQYETVTVVDNSGSSEQHRLKHVHEATWPNYTNTIPRQFTSWGHEWRAAFDDFTSRTYSGDECRLLRFPSGELPLRVDDFKVAPGMQGVVDEIRVASKHSAAGFLPLDLTLAPADPGVVVQMPSDQQARAVPSAGILTLGEEIIYYSRAAAGRRRLPFTPRVPFQKGKSDPEDYHRKDFPVVTLSGVRRAALGTNSRTHGPWSPAIFMEAQPVTELNGPTAGAIDTVPLSSAGGFEDEGYALVGSEIIGYARKRRGSLEGAHFRGAFGTTSQAHAAGTLALPLPFRYWDRYLPESDRSEMAFYQGSFSAKGTRWYTLSLNVAGTTWTRIRTQVRFDGVPGWDSVPASREGELYEFEGPGPHQLRTAGGRPVRADQIEYRILFEYLAGAAAGDGWKQTPRIDSLFIEYGNPLVVLRREVGIR